MNCDADLEFNEMCFMYNIFESSEDLQSEVSLVDRRDVYNKISVSYVNKNSVFICEGECECIKCNYKSCCEMLELFLCELLRRAVMLPDPYCSHSSVPILAKPYGRISRKDLSRSLSIPMVTRDFDRVYNRNWKVGSKMRGRTYLGGTVLPFPVDAPKSSVISFVEFVMTLNTYDRRSMLEEGIVTRAVAERYNLIYPREGEFSRPYGTSVENLNIFATIAMILKAIYEKDLVAFGLLMAANLEMFKAVAEYLYIPVADMRDYFLSIFHPDSPAIHGATDEVSWTDALPGVMSRSPLVRAVIKFSTLFMSAQFIRETSLWQYLNELISPNFAKITTAVVGVKLFYEVILALWEGYQRMENFSDWKGLLGLSYDAAFTSAVRAMQVERQGAYNNGDIDKLIEEIDKLFDSRKNLNNSPAIERMLEFLVRRKKELYVLRDNYHPRKIPKLVWLNGPPGTGKTTLIDTLLDSVAIRDGVPRVPGDVITYFIHDKFPAEAATMYDARYMIINDIPDDYSEFSTKGMVPLDVLLQQLLDTSPFTIQAAFEKGVVYNKIEYVFITSNHYSYKMSSDSEKLQRRLDCSLLLDMRYHGVGSYEEISSLGDKRNDHIRFHLLKANCSKRSNLISFNKVAGDTPKHPSEIYKYMFTYFEDQDSRNSSRKDLIETDRCKCGVGIKFHRRDGDYVPLTDMCPPLATVIDVPARCVRGRELRNHGACVCIQRNSEAFITTTITGLFCYCGVLAEQHGAFTPEECYSFAVDQGFASTSDGEVERHVAGDLHYISTVMLEYMKAHPNLIHLFAFQLTDRGKAIHSPELLYYSYNIAEEDEKPYVVTAIEMVAPHAPLLWRNFLAKDYVDPHFRSLCYSYFPTPSTTTVEPLSSDSESVPDDNGTESVPVLPLDQEEKEDEFATPYSLIAPFVFLWGWWSMMHAITYLKGWSLFFRLAVINVQMQLINALATLMQFAVVLGIMHYAADKFRVQAMIVQFKLWVAVNRIKYFVKKNSATIAAAGLLGALGATMYTRRSSAATIQGGVNRMNYNPDSLTTMVKKTEQSLIGKARSWANNRPIERTILATHHVNGEDLRSKVLRNTRQSFFCDLSDPSTTTMKGQVFMVSRTTWVINKHYLTSMKDGVWQLRPTICRIDGNDVVIHVQDMREITPSEAVVVRVSYDHTVEDLSKFLPKTLQFDMSYDALYCPTGQEVVVKAEEVALTDGRGTYAAFTAKLETECGDCGNVLLGKLGESHFILGILFAGKPSALFGHTTHFTPIMFQAQPVARVVVPDVPDIGPLDQISELNNDRHTNLLPLGTNPSDGLQSFRTSYKKSRLYDYLCHKLSEEYSFPLKIAGNVSTEPGVYVHGSAWKHTFKRMDLPNQFSHCDLASAAVSYAERFGHTRSVLAPLTLEQAFFGEPDMGIDGFPMKTSAGPHWRKCGYKRKEDLFELDESGRYSLKPVFLAAVRKGLENLENGVIVAPHVELAAKDEIRPVRKLREFNIRLFSVVDADYNVILRMYLMPLITLMLREKETSECFGQMHAASKQWTDLVDYLQKPGFVHYADMDFSAFDSCHDSKIFEAVATVFAIIAAKSGYSESDTMKVYYLVSTMNLQLCQYKGDYFLKNKGMPSGVIITLMMNSVANSILMRVVYSFLTQRPLAQFNDDVRLATVGDDNIHSFRADLVGIFSMAKAVDVYKILGYTITPALKGKDFAESLELSDLTFVKRRFVRWDDGFYRAPLDTDSIYKAFCFETNRSDVSSVERLRSVYISGCYEAYLHGREFYDEFVASLSLLYDEHNLPYEELEFDSLNNLFLSTGIETQFA